MVHGILVDSCTPDQFARFELLREQTFAHWKVRIFAPLHISLTTTRKLDLADNMLVHDRALVAHPDYHLKIFFWLDKNGTVEKVVDIWSTIHGVAGGRIGYCWAGVPHRCLKKPNVSSTFICFSSFGCFQ